MLHVLPNGTAIILEDVEYIETQPAEPADPGAGVLGKMRRLMIEARDSRNFIVDGDLDAIRDDLVCRVNEARKLADGRTQDDYTAGITEALNSIAATLERIAGVLAQR